MGTPAERPPQSIERRRLIRIILSNHTRNVSGLRQYTHAYTLLLAQVDPVNTRASSMQRRRSSQSSLVKVRRAGTTDSMHPPIDRIQTTRLSLSVKSEQCHQLTRLRSSLPVPTRTQPAGHRPPRPPPRRRRAHHHGLPPPHRPGRRQRERRHALSAAAAGGPHGGQARGQGLRQQRRRGGRQRGPHGGGRALAPWVQQGAGGRR